MTWSAKSRRRAQLPPNWGNEIRPRILRRDGHQCTWTTNGTRCTHPATDVDHVGNPADHGDSNLRSLCGWHHRQRTARQGVAARHPALTQRRPAERHPGLS